MESVSCGSRRLIVHTRPLLAANMTLQQDVLCTANECAPWAHLVGRPGRSGSSKTLEKAIASRLAFCGKLCLFPARTLARNVHISLFDLIGCSLFHPHLHQFKPIVHRQREPYDSYVVTVVSSSTCSLARRRVNDSPIGSCFNS